MKPLLPRRTALCSVVRNSGEIEKTIMPASFPIRVFDPVAHLKGDAPRYAAQDRLADKEASAPCHVHANMLAVGKADRRRMAVERCAYELAVRACERNLDRRAANSGACEIHSTRSKPAPSAASLGFNSDIEPRMLSMTRRTCSSNAPDRLYVLSQARLAAASRSWSTTDTRRTTVPSMMAEAKSATARLRSRPEVLICRRVPGLSVPHWACGLECFKPSLLCSEGKAEPETSM